LWSSKGEFRRKVSRALLVLVRADVNPARCLTDDSIIFTLILPPRAVLDSLPLGAVLSKSVPLPLAHTRLDSLDRKRLQRHVRSCWDQYVSPFSCLSKADVYFQKLPLRSRMSCHASQHWPTRSLGSTIRSTRILGKPSPSLLLVRSNGMTKYGRLEEKSSKPVLKRYVYLQTPQDIPHVFQMTTPDSPPLLLVIMPSTSSILHSRAETPLQQRARTSLAAGCYESNGTCSDSTSCYGRGSCTLKSSNSAGECWGCKCATGYAGVECQKEDYSVYVPLDHL